LAGITDKSHVFSFGGNSHILLVM